MPATHTKISETSFQGGIGALLGIALILALGRTYIRLHQFHRIFVDDGLFFLATITLIAGTVMTYTDLRYIYLQENVESGVQAPPPNLVEQLLRSVKLQDAAAVLLSATIWAVKFSFLFFFRSLLRRLRKMMIWWWCVLVFLIPSAAINICSIFITCPYFDDRILVKCTTAGALARQNATLKAVTILDIFSDVFLISIPILLLWRVRISLRRKAALGTILCLSIFTMIICIVKVSGGNTIDGQVDSSWVIFWLQAEAAVSVIIVSMTAFRALFVPDKSRYQESPKEVRGSPDGVWSHVKDPLGRHLPKIPSPTFTGVRTIIRNSPYAPNDGTAYDDMSLSKGNRGVRATHDVSSVGSEEKPRLSYESFV